MSLKDPPAEDRDGLFSISPRQEDKVDLKWIGKASFVEGLGRPDRPGGSF